MKNQLKNNNNLKVFIFCVFASVLIWTSMSLTKTYQRSYDFPISLVNIPNTKKVLNDSIIIKSIIKASGWDLLTNDIKNRKILIDLNNYSLQNKINFSNTKSIIKKQHIDLNILEVSPSFFTLNFQDLKSKKVMVKLNVKKNFSPNFFFSKKPILTPDSIMISSDSTSLSEIKFVETEELIINEKDFDKEGVKIKTPTSIISETKTISVHFKIEEFAEKEFIVPITVENKPLNSDIVYYPEQVKLKCLVPFSEYDKITSSDFYISADFNNFEDSKNNTVNLTVVEQNKKVKNILLDKDKVEFIIYSH